MVRQAVKTMLPTLVIGVASKSLDYFATDRGSLLR